MLPRPRGIFFSPIARAVLLGGTFLLLTINLWAEPRGNNVVCREDVSPTHRDQLANKLRKITGWSDLKFDSSGTLRRGTKLPVGGSASARALVANAIYSTTVVVLEDASKRSDVAFCRVLSGRWKENAPGRPPAYVVQIDFADFEQVIGDEPALESFNVGWGLLHELDHIVNDSPDATSLGETGECESHINQMRRECNLPERANYFYTFLPPATDTAFMTRFVRLAFDQELPTANKKKRYWLVWDVKVVGGLDEAQQIAALR